jgi:hypothetical protein
MFRGRGESEGWIASQLSQLQHIYVPPEYRPAFTGLAHGPAGTILVRRALPIDSITSAILEGFRPPLREFWSRVWDIYSSDGRYLGELLFPERMTVHRIRGSYVYGVQLDDLGVQQVVRLRIITK